MAATHLGPARTKFFDEWNDPAAFGREEYIAALLDSVFVACPDGVNPETFRFYEALECGCVPLVVRTPHNAAWLDWVTERVPVLATNSWEEQVGLIQHLMQQKPMLEAYRDKLLRGWMAWREELKREVRARLAL